ncbi:SRPBCC family protein [Hymenobacter sp. DH14]|uniref:SRPBCC family protein n=1 Tax=Hymenobacter cyanobacteriorum TaxID=2926463 RepID=A0A9X1VEW5_9BACT|nr:SRPBCC family protein [Hymenobacter cyanobacteriorum]MCI1187333.1 SRPBCC family protein [Hymenobacter cyanobacteriorum]
MLTSENQPEPTEPDPAGNDPAAATPAFAQFQNATPLPPGAEASNLPDEDEPNSAWGSALLAIVGTALVAGGLGTLLMWLSLRQYESYGATLFCLSPTICSFVAVLLYKRNQPGRAGGIWSVSWAVVAIMAVLASMLLLVSAKGEGIICVLMALPFALIMAVIGGFLGQAVVEMRGPRRPLPVLAVVLLLYPAAQEYEVRHPAPVLPRRVRTQLLVNAPPAAVWAVLMRPVAYPAANNWFRAGVVYPTRTAFALDSATGRRTLVCRYSQGVARLPVVGWEPGRSLTFAVPSPSMPAPMRELSPYPDVHAPHLHGFFQVDSGTFRLRPLPGGRTLLEARTVYRHSIGPQFYWQLWSDYLLDTMHGQVLATLKERAEANYTHK